MGNAYLFAVMLPHNSLPKAIMSQGTVSDLLLLSLVSCEKIGKSSFGQCPAIAGATSFSVPKCTQRLPSGLVR